MDSKVDAAKHASSLRALHITAEDVEEQEERAVAAAAFSLVATAPTESVLAGPGTFAGPIRYLAPGTVAELFLEYKALMLQRGSPVASQRTFCRIFRSVFQTHLKFRGKTEHAMCTQCAGYKDRLRCLTNSPTAHKQTLALYMSHLATTWLDRQCHNNSCELSMTCATLLRSGHLLGSMSLSGSVAHLDIDGIDQAKFRMPKKFDKTHAFNTLIRPAIHVQGSWLQGFAYHLALSDGDMMKNTNNNVEVIARTLSAVYDQCSRKLPLGLVLKQDNCARECKNGKIDKFAIALVALGIFRWVSLEYFITGHTHSPLDGTFGQLCVKLSFKEFDDDKECLRLLNDILAELGVDGSTREHALAYKMDEAADWEEWWDQVPAHFSQLCGPEAPHYFRACRRCDLGLLDMHSHLGQAEADCPIERLLETPPSAEAAHVALIMFLIICRAAQKLCRTSCWSSSPECHL